MAVYKKGKCSETVGRVDVGELAGRAGLDPLFIATAVRQRTWRIPRMVTLTTAK